MLKLNVPLVSQAKSCTCWHASSMMIWRYWQQETGKAGPMNSLYDKWQENNPINYFQFAELAKKVGLIQVPKEAKWPYKAEELQELLRNYGPIWCAGNWFGTGHVIVLTGVDSELFYYNDPAGGRKRFHYIPWFNMKIHYMMAKNKDAY